DVIIPCSNDFDELASYANRMSATVVENTLKSVGLEVKAINSRAPERFNKAMGEMDDNLARILAKSQKVYPAKKTHDTKSMSQHSSKNDTTNEKSNKSKGKCWLCNRTIKKSAKKNDKKFCKGTENPSAAEVKKNSKSGSGARLAKHILADGWKGKDFEDHPRFHKVQPKPKSGNLQAHHVITSETVKEKKWKKYRSHFKYDIDESKNGVFLPNQTDVACQLGVAVHKGPHASGLDYSTALLLIRSGKDIPDEISKGLKSSKLTYIAAVERELEKIEKLFKKGGFCGSNPDNEQFFDEMRELSHRGVEHIDSFTWTISGCGQD
ncbi:AHH domain-containing protein, partial [Moritella viscosa]